MSNSKQGKKEKKDIPFLAASKFISTHLGKINISVLLLGIVIYGFWSISIGPDNSWDFRNYHYYNAYSFLEGRLTFDFAPAQLQTYFNPLLDLIFYSLTKILKPIYVGFVMGGIHGINFFLIFAIAYRILSKESPFIRFLISILSAGVGMYGPVTLVELGATQNDLFISIFVLGSVLTALKSQKPSEYGISQYHRNWIVTSGLLVGMAVGLKLTASIYLISFFPALMFLVKGWSVRLRFLTFWVGGVAAGVILTDGYWLYTMWNNYGNPFFPLFNSVFKSPYYDIRNFQDLRYMPKSFTDTLILPFKFLTHNYFTERSHEFRDARYAILYSLSIALILKTKKKGKTPKNKNYNSDLYLSGFARDQIFLLVFFLLSYVIWQLQFSILRYTSSLEHLGPLLVVLLISYLLSNAYLQRLSMLILFSVIVLVAKPPISEHLRWQNKYVDVSVPEFSEPENTIVLIAGRRPWSYMIPFFQKDIRFMRIGGNFTKPDRQTMYITEMKSILKQHTGELYLLSRTNFIRNEISYLRAYGLLLIDRTPKPIKSKQERPGLFLWQVKKQ